MKRGADISDLLSPLGAKPYQVYLSNIAQSADVLEWILAQFGEGAEIWQTSFSISEEYLRRLFHICRQFKPASVSLILDHKATEKTLRLWVFISELIQNTYLEANHSKVLLVRSRKGRTAAVITSQNLTRGNRMESTLITSDPEIFKSLLTQVQDIINHNSACLNELLAERITAD